MLAIPELEMILIQPPRTASTALRAAVESRYPQTRRLYRHMERDGLPAAYAGWRVACTLRHPFSRLHSVWRYMRAQRPEDHSDKAWVARVRRDAARDFPDWAVNSLDPFNSRPQSDIPDPGFYDILHSEPIARKSLWRWARPDLGPVTLLPVESSTRICNCLGVAPDPRHSNAAPGPDLPPLSPKLQQHFQEYFSWDLAQYSALRSDRPREALLQGAAA